MGEVLMSDYELYTLAAKYEEISILIAGLFVTVISGFLVMSYTIGGRLTRAQTWLVASLFATFSSGSLYGMVAYGRLSDMFYPWNWRDTDRQPFSLISTSDPFNGAHFIILGGVAIIIGCLMFLRDVRVRAAFDAAGSDADIVDECAELRGGMPASTDGVLEESSHQEATDKLESAPLEQENGQQPPQSEINDNTG